MPSVFVSFSFADRPLAERVVTCLQQYGMTVWLCTEELRAGGTFDAQIQAAIAACDFGLLLLSPASAASAECHAEWRYVLSLPGHRLYVAQVVPTPPEDISYRLRIYQHADLTQYFKAGTESLARAMLADTDLDPAAPTTRRSSPVSGDVPWWQAELPIIGRAPQLAELTQALAARHRVLLTGGGGVGKTRLALEATLTAAFADGVVWFRLPAASSAEQAARGEGELTDLLRSHLNLPASTEPAEVWRQLGRVQLLLVLDNAEECQHPQPYVARLQHLETRGGTAVLLTSRYDWPTLSQFWQQSLLVPDRAAASQITQQLASLLTDRPPLTQAEAAALAEAAYDNPRLLTAAVPLLKTYPAAEVVARLQALRGHSLEETIQEIVHHTLELLSQQPDGPAAHAALHQLVACRGGFTLAAAQALLGPAVETLDTLRAWSLLRVNGWRYLLEPIVLAAVVPDEAVYPVFYHYYGELTLTLADRQQYAELATELPNIQAAFTWALRTGRLTNAFGLAAAAAEMLHNRGLFIQEREWLEQLAAQPPGEDAEFLAALANLWGHFYLRQPLGNHHENLLASVAAFKRALTHCSPYANVAQYAAAQSNLGAAYLRLAELGQPRHYLKLALAALQESARTSNSTEAALGYATTQDNLGNIYVALAKLENRAYNLAAVFQAYEVALDYRTPETAPLDYAHTLSNLGVAYMELAVLENFLENTRWAAALFLEALDYHTFELAPHAYAKSQLNLAAAQIDIGKYLEAPEELARAVRGYTQALRVFTPEQYPQEYAKLQHNLGSLHHQLADYAGPVEQPNLLLAAIEAYRKALPFRLVATAPLLRATTLHNLGIVYRALAAFTDQLINLHRARHCYQQALELRDQQLVPHLYAQTQDSLGNLYRDLATATGQRTYLAQALAAFAQARAATSPIDTPLDYARIVSNQAGAYTDTEQLTEAAANWRIAAALYEQNGQAALAAGCRKRISNLPGTV